MRWLAEFLEGFDDDAAIYVDAESWIKAREQVAQRWDCNVYDPKLRVVRALEAPPLDRALHLEETDGAPSKVAPPSSRRKGKAPHAR